MAPRDSGDWIEDMNKRFTKRKYCPFTADPQLAEGITYKNPELLRRFLGDNGKIIPRRLSGVNSFYQRRLSAEIKRARHLAILPYTTEGSLFVRRQRR
jgi:small subunit ribosomal protein S18